MGARVVNGLRGFRARCLDPNTRAMHRARAQTAAIKIGNLLGEAIFSCILKVSYRIVVYRHISVCILKLSLGDTSLPGIGQAIPVSQ